MRSMVDTDTVQQFVDAVATTELRPLSSEPHNGRMYSYGGILPDSGEPAVLELPRGVHWLNDTSSAESPSRLYVRPAYQVLLLLAMAFVDHTEVPHHRVVITGSSGTGKTSFLSWMLRHLRRLDKPPVIVLDMAGFFGRIASDGGVTAGTRGSSFQQELATASRSTVYLCDTTWTEDIEYSGPDIRARTIVVSPPMHTVMSTSPTDTMRTLVLVMPLWTMAELETCRSTCYARSVSQETLLELYQLWGGVVRLTLGTPKQEARHEFVRSLEALPFASVIRIIRNDGLVRMHEFDADLEITIGARLIHIHVDSDSTFQFSGAAVCSSLACSLLIGSSSEQLENANELVSPSGCLVVPRNMEVFYQQVQQVLFDRDSATP
ncbi:hypothetical protein PF004_g18655 [Phytophthora fragariae]|uniref:Uncharacterized protein n=2 Tax=Phytophthora fragariae TaxID=53985 RepID=A0A6A3JAC7_9STRA|nr:hypothetical protein PF011_g18827 [Phytophthora fragariae]KAE9201662.1 hypothetical protein PF004_g18655 [Phytophthora fragariae]